MKIINILLVSVISTTILSSCNKKHSPDIKLKNQVDSITYCVGVSFGEHLINNDLKDIDFNLLSAVFEKVVNKDSLLFDVKKANEYINNYLNKKFEEKAAVNMEEGRKFLEENKAKEGVVTLPSGLQYRVITEGTGPKPTLTDKVKTIYKGTLIDGTVFDSSTIENPTTFPVNRVIPGWTEALQLMNVGSKWEIYIPAELGYGMRIRPGSKIGPNMALIFEMELLAIEPQPENLKK